MIDLPEYWFLEPDALKRQVVISDVYRIDGIGDVSTDWTVGSEEVHKKMIAGLKPAYFSMDGKDYATLEELVMAISVSDRRDEIRLNMAPEYEAEFWRLIREASAI